MIDQFARNIDYLRISVTDRCNLRCIYCMPKDGIECFNHDDILTYEEILRVCKVSASLGIHKIKVTGGEPLVRKNIGSLIKQIKEIDGIDEVTLTSNGILLYDMLEDLEEASLDAINISLDTLNQQKYHQITRYDGLSQVLGTIQKACSMSFTSIKVNCLVIKDFNTDELADIAALAKNSQVHVRFIELMPIGFGKEYQGVTRDVIMKQLQQSYGTLIPTFEKLGNGPAAYYNIQGFQGKIGFISAVSHEFCESCNRIRLTSDGELKLCLHKNKGLNLKDILRDGVTDDEELSRIMKESIWLKPQQHSFCIPTDETQLEQRNMVQIGG